ncbi:MAG: ribonuclease III [Deltaproteobacteria bacterium]|nr:ribonuclease III [Deltaproteobacteria bacterium]
MKREALLKKFKEGLAFAFKDQSLAEAVFVHTSYLNEKEGRGLRSNERLEFLGDAVLSSAVSHLLFERFPDMNEGEMTAIRARLINRRTLAMLSKELGLGPLMLLGKGERAGGGAENPTILSDAFEALIAAAYMDQGYPAVFSFVKGVFTPLMEASSIGSGHFDFKPRLQELAQRHFKEAPVYRLVKETGPAHRRLFSVEAVIAGTVLGRAAGTTKKDAEQLSARQALETLKQRGYEI